MMLLTAVAVYFDFVFAALAAAAVVVLMSAAFELPATSEYLLNWHSKQE